MSGPIGRFSHHFARVQDISLRIVFHFGRRPVMRGFRMRQCLRLVILGYLVCTGPAFGDDPAPAKDVPAQAAGTSEQPAGAKAVGPDSAKSDEAKLLAAVREAMERNAQELKALKEQYAKDMADQRKKAEAQQDQIQTLQRHAQVLEDRLKVAEAQKPNPPAGQNVQGPDRQQRLSDIQQKQLKLLQEQLGLVGDEVEKAGPAIEKLQSQTATLESRSKQAAQRDQQLADAQDSLRDTVDSQQRNFTWLPAPLKEWFLPSGTNVTPISIWNTVSTRWDIFQGQRGAGQFQFEEYTPFFLVQLNKRMLLSAETSFTQGGVGLGQAQIDIFLNNWLTADIGYFLAPIGFWNERLDPRWINKLPDTPLVMHQVIPDGLTVTGLQLRGAKYLFGSPVKMEYAAFLSNGLGVPGAGKASDWGDLGGLIGTTGGVNNAMAYGGRIGFWLPTRGINFGASELVSAPYGVGSGPVYSIWQPYFNYHRGNWDFRFEYGNNYENVKTFIGNNIRREGMYAQVAYRNYASLRQHLQRLEYVFRFSDAFFHGIDQSTVNLSSFTPLTNAPVDRNQYTIGVNYYLYASSILKFAYEINSELHRPLHDNVFMMQFATNF
jgi:hypothetical protein